VRPRTLQTAFVYKVLQLSLIITELSVFLLQIS
jgi:hypothetical protein